jgi:hypothetical protein
MEIAAGELDHHAEGPIMHRSVYLVFVLALAALTNPAHGAVIAQNTDASGSDPGVYGQPFTTPADGALDLLDAFTWLAPNGSTPVGGGRVYLFGSAYSGAATGLSSASYLAQSELYAAGLYDFSGSIFLQPATTYWIYADTVLDVGFRFGSGPGHFWAATTASNFAAFDGTTNYRVFAVPEPGTVALMAVTLFGFALSRRATRRSVARTRSAA